MTDNHVRCQCYCSTDRAVASKQSSRFRLHYYYKNYFIISARRYCDHEFVLWFILYGLFVVISRKP